MRSRAFLGGLALVLAGLASIRADDVDFEREIAPVLVDACLDCHRPGKTSGGLDITTAAALHKGGESGLVIEAGKPGESLLIQRLATGDRRDP